GSPRPRHRSRRRPCRLRYRTRLGSRAIR
ncbi:MAG: hypothetical protein AVDCRST_MAG69-326, partial [uncultured Solirubrobacteraceae bacterium]